MLEDNTNIELLLNVSYGFKTLKLLMIITSISYFVGMLWLIHIDISDSLADLFSSKED